MKTFAPEIEITEGELNNLELHSVTVIGERVSIMKVPGGWIYVFMDGQNQATPITSTFVPEK